MTYLPSRRLAGMLSLGTVAALSLSLSACSAGAGAGAPTDPVEIELKQITVGALPLALTAPLYIGMDQGFFEEEGLEVTPQMLQSGSEGVTGVLGGAFEFISVGYVPGFTAVGQGLPIKFIAGNDSGGLTEDDDWLGIVVNGESDIEGPEDLVGRTVGVNAVKGVLEIMLSAALEKKGIDPSAIEYVEIPFPEMPAVLSEGKVDSIFATEPFFTPTLNAGGRVAFFPYTTLAPGFPNSAWMAASELIESDPEMVDAFIRAITKSIEYSADNPDAVREIVPTFTAITPEVAAEMRLPDLNAAFNMDLLHELLDYTQRFGTLEEIPADDLLFYQP